MNIEIKLVDNKNFINTDIKSFIKVIYDNFYDIAQISELHHTPKEIERLLKSNKLKGFIVKVDGKIVGYLLGETHKLSDGRDVFFINYLYVGREYRKRGYATIMMKFISHNMKVNNIDTIMLNCDTSNKEVYDFYSKRGFMLDLILRRYSRYDILSLRI